MRTPLGRSLIIGVRDVIVGGLGVHRQQITFDYVDNDEVGVLGSDPSGNAENVAGAGWPSTAPDGDGEFALEGCTGWQYVTKELADHAVLPLVRPCRATTRSVPLNDRTTAQLSPIDTSRGRDKNEEKVLLFAHSFLERSVDHRGDRDLCAADRGMARPPCQGAAAIAGYPSTVRGGERICALTHQLSSRPDGSYFISVGNNDQR
jgi:hypothetical protein